MNWLEHLDVGRPIIQAPMAGVSTDAMAAAVSNAGGLGSIAVGAMGVDDARTAISATRAQTDRPFNVNVFVHAPAEADQDREGRWLRALEPLFEEFDAAPPEALHSIYPSFADDEAMLELLLELAPPVVSFHFGLPPIERIAALKLAGCTLLATVTSLNEAHLAEEAGVDVIVAQGWEAGGHRGMFDPCAKDDEIGTMALVRLLVERVNIPVVAAGGIMNGAGMAAALQLGASAVQLGTAFIGCPESAADEAYRTALNRHPALHTIMTRAISGRPARCLENRFTEWGRGQAEIPPDYPIAYDAGKAINAVAKAAGEYGFGAHWAGKGAPLLRAMPAAALVEMLWRECNESTIRLPL